MATIRKMQKSDVLHVERLLRDTWPDSERVQRTILRELEDQFSSAEYRPTFFIAEDHGCVVGCGAWNWSWVNYGMYELCWGCVREDYRGRGLGRMLVERRLNDIRSSSNDEHETSCIVMLSTHRPEIYCRYGFQPVMTLPADSTLEGDSKLMVLSLSSTHQTTPTKGDEK